MAADGRTYASLIRDVLAASKAGNLAALAAPQHHYAQIDELQRHLLELHEKIAKVAKAKESEKTTLS